MSLDGENSMEPDRCGFVSFFFSAKIFCCVFSRFSLPARMPCIAIHWTLFLVICPSILAHRFLSCLVSLFACSFNLCIRLKFIFHMSLPCTIHLTFTSSLLFIVCSRNNGHARSNPVPLGEKSSRSCCVCGID